MTEPAQVCDRRVQSIDGGEHGLSCVLLLGGSLRDEPNGKHHAGELDGADLAIRPRFDEVAEPLLAPDLLDRAEVVHDVRDALDPDLIVSIGSPPSTFPCSRARRWTALALVFRPAEVACSACRRSIRQDEECEGSIPSTATNVCSFAGDMGWASVIQHGGEPRAGLRVAVHGAELVTQRREDRERKAERAKVGRDAERVREVIAACPGIGSRDLRARTSLSGDRLAAAVAHLGAAVEVRDEAQPGRRPKTCHYLVGGTS